MIRNGIDADTVSNWWQVWRTTPDVKIVNPSERMNWYQSMSKDYNIVVLSDNPCETKFKLIIMKIAVPIKDDGQIDNHFGHCASYHVFTISEKNEIHSVETVKSPEGCGCKSNIAEVFEKEGVNVMIAGGIGNGAVKVLASHGIQVIRNCEGNDTEQVKRYLVRELVDGGRNCSSHDDEHICNHDQ